MPNTNSAKKAVRSSKKKRTHNLMWKKRVKLSLKSISAGLHDKETAQVLAEKLKSAQKVLDKAAKEKVLHKNKVNRLKSRYAKKLAAQSTGSSKKSK